MRYHKLFFLAALAVALMAASANADDEGGRSCTDEEIAHSNKNYKDAKTAESAGRYLDAYLLYIDTYCMSEEGRSSYGRRIEKQRVLLKLASAAESAGRHFDAYLLYDGAVINCGHEDAKLNAECKGVERMLMKFGSDAEAAGRLYVKDEEIYRLVKDDRCGEGAADKPRINPLFCKEGSRKELNPRAGAFVFYEKGDHYVKAGAVIVKFAKAHPKDKEAFAVAHSYVTNHHVSKHVPPEQAEALKKIASANISDALAAEEKEFADKVVRVEGSEVNRSMKRLGEANAWWSFFKQGAEINARAAKRGDEILAAKMSTPYGPTLSEVSGYYKLADDAARMNKLKAQAEKRGDEALAAGDNKDAAQCYYLSGNKAKQNAAEAKAKSVAEQQKRESRKDDKARKKFKKESDSLEKELGI